jgi:hypothetical protein
MANAELARAARQAADPKVAAWMSAMSRDGGEESEKADRHQVSPNGAGRRKAAGVQNRGHCHCSNE